MAGDKPDPELFTASTCKIPTLDVFAVGQGMVDYSFQVSPEDLLHEKLQAVPGGRRIVSASDVEGILEYFITRHIPIKANGGGSLNNTMVGLAMLRAAQGQRQLESRSRQLQTVQGDAKPYTFVGMVADNFYQRYYQQNGEEIADHICTLEPWAQPKHQSEAQSSGSSNQPGSGSVIVLVTPDGQRSFLSDPQFGVSDFVVTDAMKQRLENSKWLFIEGYLLEHKHVLDQLDILCDLADKYDIRVVLSAGDVSIVSKARDQFYERLLSRKRSSEGRKGQPLVDLLFANTEEGHALVGTSGSECVGAKDIARQLVSPSDSGPVVSVAVVTDGERGSHISVGGSQSVGEDLHIDIPAAPADRVDTCGAGDSYAAGFLYALTAVLVHSSTVDLGKLTGQEWSLIGMFASKMASIVVGQTKNVVDKGDERVLDLVGGLMERFARAPPTEAQVVEASLAELAKASLAQAGTFRPYMDKAGQVEEDQLPSFPAGTHAPFIVPSFTQKRVPRFGVQGA